MGIVFFQNKGFADMFFLVVLNRTVLRPQQKRRKRWISFARHDNCMVLLAYGLHVSPLIFQNIPDFMKR